MKKKVLALVLAAAMASSMTTSISVFAETATEEKADEKKDDAANEKKDDAADEKKDDAADEKKDDAADEKKDDAADEKKDDAKDGETKGVTEDELPAKPEFEPNKDYDKYTVVEYTIEDIQADLVCTVSAKEDDSEFYLECNFYGDDQMTKTKYDGKEFTVEEDKTGFMKGDTPAILQKALDQDLWVYFDGAADDKDAAATDGATATAADLPAEAQFEPNKDYDEYTVVEYTIEDIQADLVCTVSTNKDHTEFYLECNFYGDDQMTKTTYDGKEYTVEEDKTGFMKGDTPAILDKALEQNIWVPIEK